MENTNRLYSEDEVREIYYEISRTYSSPYNDNRDDLKDAIRMIHDALNVRKLSKEFLLAKLTELMEFEDSDFKTKISTLLLNRYWEKSYRPEIKRKVFNPN